MVRLNLLLKGWDDVRKERPYCGQEYKGRYYLSFASYGVGVVVHRGSCWLADALRQARALCF